MRGRTAIEVFVAVTRAVREGAMSSATKANVFAALDRLAHRLGLPDAAEALDKLKAAIEADEGAGEVLRPYLPALERVASRRPGAKA